MILLTLILAGILLLTEHRITAFNSNVKWNGYGAMRSVIAGEAMAPMQYRVLIPWMWWHSGHWGKRGYIGIKGFGIWLMLFGFAEFLRALGMNQVVGVFALAAILPATFLFDYADCYYEMGFLSLAYAYSMMYSANIALMLLVPLTIAAALNRETAVFIPLGYLILNGGIVGTIVLGAVWLVAYLFPRIYYGRKGRYCDAVMFKQNIFYWKKSFSVYHLSYLVFMAVTVGAMVFSPPFTHSLGLLWLTLIFLVVLHIPSLWHEIRVFIPVLLYTIPAIIKGLM